MGRSKQKQKVVSHRRSATEFTKTIKKDKKNGSKETSLREANPVFPKKKTTRTGSMLQAMREKLQGGKFRWLNEIMYTRHSSESLSMMQETPELYQEYHQGYREQTKQWPERPVDRAIAWLKKKPKDWMVVDLGCGDAELSVKAPQHDVRNFDLSSSSPRVTVCNIASLPLADSSVNVAVFCLSLMGVDYGTFIEEACRVLKSSQGWLWIAEVQSRCVDEQGNSILDTLISRIELLGFKLRSKSTENSHFFIIIFEKMPMSVGQRQTNVPWPQLRACVYKKR
jgi:ribosomal RNA-processing protein 8